MAFQTIDPSSGELIKSFEEVSLNEANHKIYLANESFLKWQTVSYRERANILNATAKILRNNLNKYANLITLEMGKPIKQAEAEIEKCALVCEYYANNTESILQNELIQTDATESFVRFDPLGVILAVMPWNFPFWQVFRFAAPALMAGNVCILKHASNVPQCALEIENIFIQAGLPENTFSTLLVSSSLVSNIIDNNFIKAVTLTGSEAAGKNIAQQCGKNLKKSVLELGGSDPFIILEDADIEAAVKSGITSRMINNGQSCIAAKRFIVCKAVFEKFIHLFAQGFSKIRTGNPSDPETELGPLARKDLLTELIEQVAESVKSGAKILCGGNIVEGKGYYYEPTILTDVHKGIPAYSDELFGPVASVIKVKNADEAIQTANDTNFGLGASLWTEDITKAKKLAAEINSGSVFINGMVKSDPRLPFGGINNSGYGRELSHYGIKEFVNIKTVWIA